MKNLIYIGLLSILPITGIESTEHIGETEMPSANLKTIEQIIGPNPFAISAGIAQEFMDTYEIGIEELLQMLVPIAQKYARPSISNYPVGVAALGKSGTIYLGVNLEFTGVPLNETVHAEQFLVAFARQLGEKSLVAMALSAAPCGHCRQFLYEMGESQSLKLIIKDQPAIYLSDLLPNAFSLQDLGIEGGFMDKPTDDRMWTQDYSLKTLATKAAFSSFAPISNAKAGIALLTKDGCIYSGSYLETAAFNPSLSPLQVALVAFVADDRKYEEITDVLLVEGENPKISHEAVSRETLKSIAPNASFKKLNASFG
jgi:cytidine deaminase